MTRQPSYISRFFFQVCHTWDSTHCPFQDLHTVSPPPIPPIFVLFFANLCNVSFVFTVSYFHVFHSLKTFTFLYNKVFKVTGGCCRGRRTVGKTRGRDGRMLFGVLP